MKTQNKKINLNQKEIDKINLLLGNKGFGSKGLGKTLTDQTPYRFIAELNGGCNETYLEIFQESILDKKLMKQKFSNFLRNSGYHSNEKVNILSYNN